MPGTEPTPQTGNGTPPLDRAARSHAYRAAYEGGRRVAEVLAGGSFLRPLRLGDLFPAGARASQLTEYRPKEASARDTDLTVQSIREGIARERPTIPDGLAQGPTPP